MSGNLIVECKSCGEHNTYQIDGLKFTCQPQTGQREITSTRIHANAQVELKCAYCANQMAITYGTGITGDQMDSVSFTSLGCDVIDDTINIAKPD